MSIENVFVSSFLASLTPAHREQLEKLGELDLRIYLEKLFPGPTLPEGWVLSERSITVIVNYDDPRWGEIPTPGGKYNYVNPELSPRDFPKGERTGRWEITLRWLKNSLGCSTQQALEAIAASTLPGANRAETESLIDAHPANWWAGFADSLFGGVYGCPDGSRDLMRSGARRYWGLHVQFLVVWLTRPVDQNP